MTASRSIGPILHRDGLSHRCAKEGSATSIPVTDLDTPKRFRQPLATCHLSRISAISNRYNKLLEFLVTDTKQTTAPHSNRYKTPLFPVSFAEPECGPLAFVGPDFSRVRVKSRQVNDRRYWAEGARNTPRRLPGHSPLATRHCRFLIYNPELETELTCTKQKADVISNRQFFAFLKLLDTPRRSANFSQTGLA